MYENNRRIQAIPIAGFRKMLLVMKLTTLILITTLVQVSAVSHAQKITLKRKSASLESIFKELRIQTGYDFFFDRNSLQKAVPVSIDVKEATLEEVLEELFVKQQLVYAIESKTIIIKEKTPSLFERIIAHLASINLRGRVLDEKGLLLGGVSVRIKGTNTVTLTNEKGEFKLNNVPEDAMLVITYIGYDMMTLPVKENMGDIRLTMSTSELDQVQVKAYGTTNKRLSTGSQDGIKAADIEKQVVLNPLQALIGRIPGLEVTQQSGMAGAGFTIRIRGINSLRAGASDPLILVDGIPFQNSSIPALIGSNYTLTPLSSLNAADIESIDVLKDADATAIYGSRGANGIVLITTKKGKPGTTLVDFNMTHGIGKIATRAEMLNRRQYLDMRYEAFRNDGIDFRQSLYAYDLNYADTTREVDWQEELLGGTAYITNMQAMVSGGNQFTSYNFGAGYTRQTNVFRLPNNVYQRYNGRLVVNHSSSNQKFKVQFTATYGSDDNRSTAIDYIAFALRLPPVGLNFRDAQGRLNWPNVQGWDNPYAGNEISFTSLNNTFTTNANITYQLPLGIKFSTLVGFNTNTNRNNTLLPSTTINPALHSAYGPYVRSSTDVISSGSVWNIEPQLNYKAKVGPGVIDVLAGTTFQQSKTNAIAVQGYGHGSDQLLINPGTAQILVSNKTFSTYKYNAIFGRVGYNIGDKYLMNITFRRDGSSRFAPGSQFGNFGAIGAAWVFGDENWVKKALPFLSFGKLRASYGITGSDGIGDYGFYQLYNPTVQGTGNPPGYGGGAVLTPDKLLNDSFRWESNRKAEGALELGFLKGAIMLTTNYYSNRSSNQLLSLPLAATAGFANVISNLPALIQNSGWEFMLNTINLRGKNFSWTSSFNLTLPQNKLLRYDNIENSAYRYTYIVGHPLAIARTVTPYQINAQTGVREIRNAQGAITTTNLLSQNDLTNVISLFKDYFGGLSNTFNYKAFSLDVSLQFSKQMGPATNAGTFPNANLVGGFMGNMPLFWYQNRWTTPGQTGAQFQRLTQDAIALTQPAAQSRLNPSWDPNYYVNITYLRLGNLNFSYTLPVSFQQKLKLQNARVFVQGQNLFTFTGYQGMDPENQSQALPPLKMLTLGVQITL